VPKQLHVLIVEDDERDAALLMRELRRGGYDAVVERVETPEALRAALERKPWDIVLSDYSMPRFSAPEALSVVREKGQEMPFIIVSGTVGEETAVDAMRAGAHDFMPKGRLARLLPAIEREMREAAGRAQRKKMQEQLLISDRMASVGVLAASVAHEINNPLAVLATNLEIVARNFDGPGVGGPESAFAAVGEALRDAQEAAERVRLIVRDLKMFSRPGNEEQNGPVEIEEVLESSIRMASNEIRHRAQLVRDYARVPAANGNLPRLGQVFLNLIVNAAQAIPDGRAGANEIRISTRLDPQGRVVASISDTGVGMPADVLARIFDPFFTTKPVGVGTGLGLAICHRIVTSLGGEISVHSEIGKGTTFEVALPQAHAAAAPPPEAPTEAPGAQRAHVLVVDDEPMLGRAIKRILSQRHEVTVATSAIEAVRLLKGGLRFDLILSDLMMPEMTGMDLHAALLDLAPDQAERMIFMTGGAFSAEAAAFLRAIPNPSIEKPFKTDVLWQVLHSQLQQTPQK